MIQSIFYQDGNPPIYDLSIDQMRAALADQAGLLWVNLGRPDAQEVDLILRDLFKFHPLAIEDCLSLGYQPPKVDDFNHYLFIIAHAVEPQATFRTLKTTELNLFIGKNYVVTSHLEERMTPISKVQAQLARDERLYRNGSDFLAHALLDYLVDEYMPLLDQMDEEIEWLEDQILANPRSATLERILDLKHAVMSLRRIIGPMREMANRLSRDDFTVIDRQSRIYFRDIYDHLVRIQDLSESIRDIVSGAMDIYLNSTSLRLNEVMKALTIVSTIFLPLSFLAGVFGMNFVVFPEIHWQYGYAYAWVLFILIAALMLYFFKRRRWF